MKTWLWALVLFVAAVALALILREHSGNVLIIAQPWRIELSLTLAVLILLVGFVFLHILLRVIAWFGDSPDRLRSWRSRRLQKRDQDLMESGLIGILEGRYPQAEKSLTKLLAQTRSNQRKVLAGLASARALHDMGDFARRDQALAAAQEAAGQDVRLKEAAATVAAEMYLDQNRPQDALVLLQPIQDANSRYFHATRLLLRSHRQLRNYDRVYDLARLLLRRSAIDKTEAMGLIETAAAARLQVGGMESFKSIWGDLKSEERVLPDVALAAAAIQSFAGEHIEAAKILEAAIEVRMDPRLLNAYSQCPPEAVARRLSKGEVWLKSHPDDSALLAALGNLCLTGELWGQGERYLLRSMKIRSDVRIHALLGNLYDRLGRGDEAMKHWRLASSVAGVLPVLPGSRVLPAADTRMDPSLVDVDDLTVQEIAEGADLPVAASAADYVHEDAAPADTAPYDPDQPREHAASSSSELDDYFDSAPIPGVDLTQTSDRSYPHPSYQDHRERDPERN
ncbi:MAG: heme biosynthesis HemY N-terminal domain-containing protein [Candidimonas sp.]